MKLKKETKNQTFVFCGKEYTEQSGGKQIRVFNWEFEGIEIGGEELGFGQSPIRKMEGGRKLIKLKMIIFSESKRC